MYRTAAERIPEPKRKPYKTPYVFHIGSVCPCCDGSRGVLRGMDALMNVHRIEITLNDAQWEKLRKLAEYRRLSMRDAIVDMIDKSIPGGTGQHHQAGQPPRKVTPQPSGGGT